MPELVEEEHPACDDDPYAGDKVAARDGVGEEEVQLITDMVPATRGKTQVRTLSFNLNNETHI
jgi:hypothetical protein